MRKSHRSVLTGMLREAQSVLSQSHATGAPIDEVTAMRAERAQMVARRRVLGGALATAAATMLPRPSLAVGQPRVLIVGAGIAGLSCALKLWSQRGIRATIYEWNTRIGGRIQTLRDYFANGQSAEQHGEFISSEHAATMRLAKRFGLELENTYAAPKGTKDTYWFAGERYTQKELNADWRDFGYQLFRDAVRKASRANYQHATKMAYHWDHMPVPEWIDRYVPGGLQGRFGKLCYSDVIDEYGGPPESQSALNLLYILGYNDSSPNGYQSPDVPMLAGSDEKWHIKGGNDQLVTALASRLPDGSINLGYELIALAENSDGSFTCTFSVGSSTTEVVADHVVLTLPFTTLRNVDLSGVTLSPLKQTAIKSLPLGNNAKIQIQIAGRPWIKEGFDGGTFTDAAFDGGWDGTSYQNQGKRSPTEIFVALPGGADGAGLASKYGLVFGNEQGPAPTRLVTDTLAGLEPIFPGVTAAWRRGPQLAWVNDGNIDRYLLGAWSQYNVGQYTGFSGVEGLREGNIHFAGEHTSIEFQGFIEGAVRSGLRAADEI